eukprot:6299585-Prymnesium_polylepis.1
MDTAHRYAVAVLTADAVRRARSGALRHAAPARGWASSPAHRQHAAPRSPEVHPTLAPCHTKILHRGITRTNRKYGYIVTLVPLALGERDANKGEARVVKTFSLSLRRLHAGLLDP